MFKDYLKNIDACETAIEWVGEKTWKEAFETCERGDWLLWLFVKTQNDKRKLFLAKGHCANTVRHLMKDSRSIASVDAAISFGENNISETELAAAGAYAYAYAAAAAAAGAYADADATAAAYAAAAADAAAAAAAASADAAADAAAAAADAAASAYAYAYAYAYASAAAYAAAAADAARKQNQKLTADICRKYLPFEIWTINEL